MTLLRCFASLLVAAALASQAPAQCPGWTDDLGSAGVGGGVECSVVFDDGTGPALYVGGGFLSAGGHPISNLARWDGTSWSNVGGATNARVSSLVVTDDGSGPKLYAGGAFTNIGGTSIASIAKWDGSTWSPVGSGLVGPVAVLLPWQDTSGWHLYAVADVDPSPAYVGGVHVFDGTTWSQIGVAMLPFLEALAVFDAGNGPELYAAGLFSSLGGVAANNLARWNGSAWSAVNGGTDGRVSALQVFDDGSGPALFVGGDFASAGGVASPRLARYDGNGFHPVPSTPGMEPVRTLGVHDDGSGAALYAGTESLQSTPLLRFTGSGWTMPGVGFTSASSPYTTVWSITSFDDGHGTGLVAGGGFTAAGGIQSPSIALWRNGAWEAIGREAGVQGEVHALARYDDGSGEAMYVGGMFTRAGDVPCANIARFDGTSFTPLGSGIVPDPSSLIFGVEAMCAYDDGSGPALYAGGKFASAGGVSGTQSLVRWDGTSWSSLAGGVSNGGSSSPIVSALVVHDDGSGPCLYAGGTFTFAGATVVNNVARWNGTSWSALGNGLQSPVEFPVRALCVYDDGNGPELYAGGSFALSDSTWFIARWDGSAWRSVGGGIASPFASTVVTSMCVADLGAGSKLYVGGEFDGAIDGGMGVVARNLVAWDGTWSAPSGLSALVNAVDSLAAFDAGDGSGQALYVGSALGPAFNNIARYDGAALLPLSGGLTRLQGFPAVVTRSMVAFDDGLGAGPALYVGGNFELANGSPARGIARWRGCGLSGEAFCSGDGSGTACPCSNSGAGGHGCATSTNPSGAQLLGSGLSSVSSDSLVLTCSGSTSSVVTYFQGSQPVNGGAGAVFGDGLRCAGGTTLRLAHVTPVGGTSSIPVPGDPSLSVRGLIGANGGRRAYQAWFRNAASFCTPSTFNLSNGWSVVWTP